MSGLNAESTKIDVGYLVRVMDETDKTLTVVRSGFLKGRPCVLYSTDAYPVVYSVANVADTQDVDPEKQLDTFVEYLKGTDANIEVVMRGVMTSEYVNGAICLKLDGVTIAMVFMYPNMDAQRIMAVQIPDDENPNIKYSYSFWFPCEKVRNLLVKQEHYNSLVTMATTYIKGL